jgi:DNA-binding response OmpR family regulator
MKKLLIVDDHPNIRRMIRYALHDRFVVEESDSADTAYQMLMKAPPDGIVLDVMMPGVMNGFQLCERIKRDSSLADIHVVLVSACGQVADQELGRSLGANAYFVKPFSPLALAHHLIGALMQPSDRSA